MKIIESVEVVEYLKAGHFLVIIEDGTLVVLQEGKIRLQNPNWHSVVSYSDFKVLYPKAHFGLYEEEVTIDEKKDEEYYRWRAKYQ